MSYQDEYMERLHAQRHAAHNEAQELLAGVDKERGFSGEEQEKWERIQADISSLNERIISHRDSAERNREAEAALEADELRAAEQAEQARKGLAGIVAPDADESRKTRDDELVAWLRGENRSRSFDVNLAAVAAEKQAIRAGARGRELRDLQVDVTTSGGNTVPTSFERMLYDFLEVYSGIRRTRATIITTASGENMDFPKATTHGTAALVGEGTALSENDPQFGKLTLGAWKYGQLTQVTNELLTDTAVDILGFLARDAGRALARVTDTDYATGNGSSKPQGVLTAIGTGVTGQNSATGLPSYDNLVDMLYSVNEEYRMNGEWLWLDASVGALRKILDGDNRPLWEPNIQVGAPDLLLGKPIVTDPNVNALATGVVCGAFGDFSTFYIRDVANVRFERSDDFAFSSDLVTFRSILRTDSDVIETNGLQAYRGGTA